MKENESASRKADEIAEYYRKYFEIVYKYAYRVIPNTQVAEDIVQETFLVALEEPDELLEHPKPKLWLLRTARNKMLEMYRRMKYRRYEPLSETMEIPWEESLFEYEEVHLSSLAILDEEEWDLFKRYYLYGNTISELAESLGITENNLRVRFTRMKKKLRKGFQ